MTRSLRVEVNTKTVASLADRLDLVDGQALGRVGLEAVNEVADRTYERSLDRMLQGINLTDQYLRERMAVSPATNAAAPRATIAARIRHTTLGRYGYKQLVQPVRYTNAAISNLIGKLGDNPRKPGSLLPWKARTGDAYRGIPSDYKQAGISVEVVKGRRKEISYAFVIPTAGGPLAVKRIKGTRRKVEALYGPSVYQLFNHALDDDFLESIGDDLEATVVKGATETIGKILK